MTKIMTGDTALDTKIVKLLSFIRLKEKDMVLESLNDLFNDSLENSLLALWITTPSNITMLHEKLVDEMGVIQKNMQLKNRITHRQRRAVMFIKAMINGVERLE